MSLVLVLLTNSTKVEMKKMPLVLLLLIWNCFFQLIMILIVDDIKCTFYPNDDILSHVNFL